jgi:hypothetical protein
MTSPIRKVLPDGIISSKDKAVYIWLDILGYSVATENEKPEKLGEMLDKLGEYFKSTSNYETYQISDGLLLSIQKQKYNDLSKIFDEIGKLQMAFLKNTNRLLRGGIAVGSKITHENYDNFSKEIIDLVSKNGMIASNEVKKIVFKYGKKFLIGNGLSRAHNVESTTIDWPIIGTNQEKFDELKKEFSDFPADNFNFVSCINMKGEKIYFINFLEPVQDKNYYKYLIAKACDKNNDSKTQAKYIWLLRYIRQRYQITEPIPELVGLYL